MVDEVGGLKAVADEFAPVIKLSLYQLYTCNSISFEGAPWRILARALDSGSQGCGYIPTTSGPLFWVPKQDSLPILFLPTQVK